MLSLYKLEIFATAVQAGSFSRAAERLYLTQSAISQHIQDLERGLGTKLFNRGRRGVTLTASGESLYDYTRQILRLVAEAESVVTNVENLAEGQVNVGATPGVSAYLLPGWLHRFQAQYPQFTVSMTTGVTAEVVNAVLAERSVIGFVEGELDRFQHDRLGTQVLETIELAVIVGPSHPWWDEAALPTGTLEGQPFIMRQQGSQTRSWVQKVLEARDCKPRIVAEFDNPESIKHAVISGIGITIMPDYAVKREVEMGLLKAITIADMPLQRTLKLIWDTETPFGPITRVFLDSLPFAITPVG
jgi:DNA-binding transcriptional LysR family regulator